MLDGKVELFDLENDLGEEKNLASANPKMVSKAIAYMDEAHVPDPNWKVRRPRR